MTPLSLKGLAFGSFFPNPAGTYPSYTTAGEVVRGYIDEQGNVAIRGPVFTDEGGFRDGFGDAGISADWTITTLGAGCTVAMTATPGNKNPLFTLAAGGAATDRAYMTRAIDYLPIAANVQMQAFSGRVVGANFFFGLYSDPDVDVAIATGSYCEYLFTGSLAATAATITTQFNPGKIQTVTSTVTSTATAGFRSILLDGESVIFRDNTVNLPTTSTRQTLSIASPDIYTELYLGIGFRASAARGAACSTEIGAVFVKNLDRLVVNTAF